MRILLVTEDVPVQSPGGAAKHAVLLGNALIEAGHDVELLGRLRAPGVVGNNDFLGRMHCKIDLRCTGWQEFRFGAFLPGRRAHIGRRIWATVRALGVDRYDVIHYHGHHSAVGAAAPATVNFVQTLHDQGSECITLTRFKDREPCSTTDPRACASCATVHPNALQTALSAMAVRRLRRTSTIAFSRHKTIFVSGFLQRRFLENVRPQVDLKSRVVHNFTDAVHMQALVDREPPADAARAPIALIVGRIDAAKGVSALLAALPDTLLRKYRWRVLGDGPERHSAEARHRARGVEFAGFLPQDRVYAETRAATLCVVPSVWEEPCGTTALEGLLMGKPVFALDRGGTPELACYARYAGQLVLARSMACLIEALVAFRPESAPRLAGVDDAADVRRRLPAIIDIYRLPTGEPPASWLHTERAASDG